VSGKSKRGGLCFLSCLQVEHTNKWSKKKKNNRRRGSQRRSSRQEETRKGPGRRGPFPPPSSCFQPINYHECCALAFPSIPQGLILLPFGRCSSSLSLSSKWVSTAKIMGRLPNGQSWKKMGRWKGEKKRTDGLKSDRRKVYTSQELGVYWVDIAEGV